MTNPTTKSLLHGKLMEADAAIQEAARYAPHLEGLPASSLDRLRAIKDAIAKIEQEAL